MDGLLSRVSKYKLFVCLLSAIPAKKRGKGFLLIPHRVRLAGTATTASLLLISSLARAVCTTTDDTGQIIHLDNPPQRIISLAPDITETLFAIGAGKQVIAVIGGSDYPPAARKLPLVGSYSGIDLERILSLHPDLIINWSRTFSRQINVLKKHGIPVYISNPKQLDDIPKTMRKLGCLSGNELTANHQAQAFTNHIDKLKQQYQARKPISVFYQIGPYALMTINKDSWINQVITLCGGKNIFADLKPIAPEVSWEAVVTAHPQVVIAGASKDDWQRRWERWGQHPLLITINPDLIARAGPRLIDGTTQICQALQVARDKM